MNYISHPLLYRITTVPVGLHFSSLDLWHHQKVPFQQIARRYVLLCGVCKKQVCICVSVSIQLYKQIFRDFRNLCLERLTPISFITLHLSPLRPSQFSSVTQSYLTLCDPMDCSTPGFPVHHRPLELVQTHVHQVGDAIQPSHPLSSPSPPTFNLAQHQVLFQRVSSSHQVAKVLDFQPQQSVLPMNIQD